jgi:hypothetical protein
VAQVAGSHTGEFLAAMLPVKASRAHRAPQKSANGSNGSAKTNGKPARRRSAAPSSR